MQQYIYIYILAFREGCDNTHLQSASGEIIHRYLYKGIRRTVEQEGERKKKKRNSANNDDAAVGTHLLYTHTVEAASGRRPPTALLCMPESQK
jgi:hypothetical protein